MFGIRRRKTQGQLARAELNRGIGHLKQAATHVARGAGNTVGPRVQTARGAVAPTAVIVRDRASSGLATTAAALAPLALAVRNAQAEAAGKAVVGRKAAAAKQAAVTRKAKKMKAKKKSRRSGTMMAGLLAAGAVAGLAGAMALRRHREQQEWAEYDTRATLEPMHDEVETVEVRTAGPAGAGKASTGAGSSAVASGDSSTTTSTVAPKITPTEKVPSVAEGARTTSGRPADNLSKATNKSNTRA
ncbi:hypothetical protein SAMN05443287_10749 [Micromonospora phaseoli]|uniref:Uncharacterized protein n=1 Tax=Micromonospora phaseoli TaxID=1144548 RepID=A0A1H7BAM1_9ACTN|nr:hypothetical protein CLV64_108313 [Micromonospora phaseoli]GIJ78993.1 hypothetical protein Xph01_34250 [Micromonospora phaseoli]SEJ73327.1 hypothetical protein SAMN05443287_10749 [Micromonospora phaseoli]